MEQIDSAILDKGYSIFKTNDPRKYYAMSDNEVKRIHGSTGGKPYSELTDTIEVIVYELVVQADNTIVLLNEDEIIVKANSLIPVPIKLF